MWSEDSTVNNRGSFMDTTMNTSSEGNRFPSAKRSENCVSLMIAHIKRHGEDLQVWGMPVKLVTFVAIVRKIEDVSTKITFHFEDETGAIKGIKWRNEDKSDFLTPISVNKYARVFGMVRNQNDENFVLVISIQPLEHINELLAHLMEVTLISLSGEKTVRNVVQSDSLFANNVASVSDNTNIENTFGLNKEQAIVLNIIQSNSSEYGAERSDIKSKVPEYIAPKVNEILDFLANEGHIYTTKTDDFFKVI